MDEGVFDGRVSAHKLRAVTVAHFVLVSGCGNPLSPDLSRVSGNQWDGAGQNVEERQLRSLQYRK